jgi:hypothetical protein
MAARKKEINLLPKEKWETGLIGKLLKWALNVGRYVVVFTELVVIAAFLYRFGLDRQLTDLGEEINQKQAIISSYGDFETKFRRLQLQLKTIKSSEASGIKAGEILDAISQITPTEAVYSAISITPEKVALKGQLASEIGLATLLAKAQENPWFSGVVLESVSSATEETPMIDFRLQLSLKTIKE